MGTNTIIGKNESNLRIQASNLNMSGVQFFIGLPAPPHVNPDPYWANVITVLHLDGTASLSATSSVDSGPYSFTLYQSGSTLLTGSAKFGPTSLQPVSGAYLIDGNNKNYYYVSASTDFTLEFWVNGQMALNSGINGLLKTRVAADTGWGIEGYRTVDNHSFILFTYGSGSAPGLLGSVGINGATGLWDGAWHHFALVRSGTGANNIKGYLDGTNSTTYTTNLTWNGDMYASTPLILNTEYRGADYANSLVSIDELRWTTGVARYTASFTPPTAAFPDINS